MEARDRDRDREAEEGEGEEGVGDDGKGVTWKAEVYRDAIEKLSNVFPTTASISARPDFGAVSGWPVFIDRRYIALLKERDPFALLILAHYGTGLHDFEGFWQLRASGRRVVEAVGEVLGREWEGHLRWARARLREDEQRVRLR